ncbi:MAG TPA: DUF1028 domain-containing protein [Gaiellaceae bacterium]|nr:DUF1028 domain-containing protein [Gaiellaceae bacterium]
MAQGQASTFSICGLDPETGEIGVAVQSKYFAVGSVVSWARAGVGAVATQAAGIAGYGPRLLALLATGSAPDEAIRLVLDDDPGRETRQLGVVAADGRSASFTGSECNAWAGHETEPNVAGQGNILAGPDVVADMVEAFRAGAGTLAERLVAGLEAAQAAGGDVRGQQSAAVYVERPGAGEETGELIDRVVDLRVDDHPEPIAELRRLLELQLRWSFLKRASGRREAGRPEDGVEVLAEGLRRYPDDATILYDLGCYESLAGRLDDALVHVRRALELDESLRPLAAADSDLDALRGRGDSF